MINKIDQYWYLLVTKIASYQIIVEFTLLVVTTFLVIEFIIL